MSAPGVAVILHKEKLTIAEFRRAGAVSPDHAVSLEAIGAGEGIAFRRLRARAVLREAAPGRYYLDEPSWTAMRRLRRRVLGVVLIILLALVLLGVVSLRPA